MKLPGWVLLVMMVVGAVAVIIDQPLTIIVLAVIGLLVRNLRWVDR